MVFNIHNKLLSTYRLQLILAKGIVLAHTSQRQKT